MKRRTRPALPLVAGFQRRPICLAIWLLTAVPLAHALPQGATLASGQATVQQTAPGQMLIQQSSNRAGLDWTSFSIAAGERVQVQQPGSTAVLLNRVLGDNPSAIHGALSSNGSVWLINPRGIVFGAQSRVDVGGLVASTLSLAADDFTAVRLHLRQAAGSPAAALVAEGRITAADGSVVLAAPHLTQRGSIEARRIGLAAGSEVLVDTAGDGLLFLRVRNDEQLNTTLQQLGSLRADGGTVDLRAAGQRGSMATVLNVEGVVRARGLAQLRGGQIAVDGGDAGVTRLAGTLDVTSAGGVGGDVLLQGRYIAVDSSAVADASGASGGGRVRVGGGYQGADAAVRNAQGVAVWPGARLQANALQQGDGGQVVVWADGSTRFHGQADAKGGTAGGNGGLVEVSGKAYLDYRGQSDRSAPNGRAGRLLLDPDNITIGTVSDRDGDGQELRPDPPGPPIPDDLTSLTLPFAFAAVNSFITAAAVQTQLGLGSVELQAQASISVNSSISRTDNANSLTLRAGGNITIAQPITVGGNLTLSARDGGSSVPFDTARVEVGAALTAGLALNINNNSAATGVHQIGANLTADTLTLTGPAALTSNSTWTLAAASSVVNTLGGSFGLAKAGSGVLTLNGAAGYTGSTRLDAGGLTLNSTLASTAVQVNGGTLNVGGSNRLASGATVTVASAGTLALAAANTVTTLNLQGTLNGAGPLNVSGLTTLTGATVGTALNTDLLTSSGISVLLADVVVANLGLVPVGAAVTGGTLTVGNGAAAGSLALSSGVLSVNTGATLAFSRAVGTDLSLGDVAGAGTISQRGGNVLTLNGNAPDITTLDATRGTLRLGDGSGSRVNDNAAVTVVTGATFTTGATPETVGTLALAGTLNGASALTATTYTLQTGAVVSSALGAGEIRVTGSASLNAAAAAQQVNVLSSGSLTLGAAGAALSDTAAVTVNSGGTLTTTAVETVGTLTLAGTLAGPAALTATTTTLQTGAVVSGLLGAGTLQVTGAATISGTAASSPVNIGSSGHLTLSAAQRLTATPNFNFTSGGRLTLVAGVQPANRVEGTVNVDGGGSLQAADVVLNNSSIGTPLTTDRLTSDGASAVLGSLTINTGSTVNTGTLTVGDGANAGALLGAGAVTVAGGATLAYNRAGIVPANTVLGTGTLRQAGSGELQITSSATVAALQVNTGTVSLAAGSTNRISDGAAVQVATGATLRLDNSSESVNTLTTAGTVAGGTLTASSYTLQTNANVTSALGAGNLIVTGSGTLAGSAGTLAVDVQSGTLTLASAQRLPAGATVTVAANAGLRLTGNQSLNQFTSAGTLSAVNSTDTLQAAQVLLNTGASVQSPLGSGPITVEGNSSLQASAASTQVTINGGTLTLTAPERLANTAAVNITGSTGSAGLVLNGTQTVASLTSAGSVGGSAQNLVASAGVTLNTGASIAANLSTPILTVAGSSSLAGTVSAGTVNITGGTFTTSGTQRLASAANVTVSSGAQWALGGNQTVNTLALAGTLGGSGQTLTSTTGTTLNGGAVVQANLGPGSLLVAGNSSLAGTSAATTLTVNNGATLALTGSGRLAGTPAATVNGTLQLGGNETLGTLAGSSSGRVALGGATLFTGSGGSSSFGGSLNGTGTLDKRGAATSFTLTAAQGHTGSTTVSEGGLALAGSNLLNSSSTVAVASGATLSLGGNQTVTTLDLAGTLAGSGTLTAGRYNLNAGDTVTGAALGSGELHSLGNSTLAGTAAAGTVFVDGGTLNMGTANRFSNAPAITVASGATLSLSGAEAASSLTLVGTLNGTNHTLTATTASLQAGATLNAVLAGTAAAVAGNSQLNGRITSSTLAVNTGTLTLAASADRIADSTAVSVAGNAQLLLGAAETVRSLNLAGTLASTPAGNHSLTATDGSTLSAGAQVLTPLSGGPLTVTGNSELAANTTVATINVNAGQLTLTGNERLPDSATVNVASAGTLALAGNERVGTLNLAGALAGTSAGTGTLSATQTNLNGADVVANLGDGTLASLGHSHLRGTSAASAVTVNSGSLTLHGNQRLNAVPSLSVAGAAMLSLRGAQTVGTLTGAGTVDLDTHTLTVGQGLAANTSSSYSGALTGSGELIKTGAGRWAYTGNGQHTGATRVQAGTLELAGTLAGNTLQIDGGARLELAAPERLANSSVVTVAANGTLLLALAPAGLETIHTLNLAGTLEGIGTLSAAQHNLNAGRTRTGTTLAGTRVSSQGNSELAGTTSAGTLQVEGGTLALASAGRLGSSTAVAVAAGAVLQLAGAEQAASLDLAGRLDGTGHTLTTPSNLLQAGATVNAGIGGQRTRVLGNVQLNGRITTNLLDIEAGTLALAAGGNPAADRIGNSTQVSVASSAQLLLGAPETVGSLSLAGTLASTPAGSHALTTASGTELLAGAQVLTPLAGAGLIFSGDTVLAAPTSVTNLTVVAGRLTLLGDERLPDDATVNVRAGATLALAGSERVGTLNLAGTLEGTSAGVGTLSATQISFDRGLATANLGGGRLDSTGSSRLQGVSAATEVFVNGGSLTLAGADRLTAAPALTVADGATLLLQGALSVGALGGAGTLALDAHTLRVGQGLAAAASSTYTGSIGSAAAGAGGLVKVGAGRWVFNGNGSYSGSTVVQAGTLALAGTLAGTDVQVASGAQLELAAPERLANSATLTVARNGTLALNGAETVQTLNLAGTLAGNGTLTAGRMNIDGGNTQVSAALGAGELHSSGSSILAGSAAAGTVFVNSGSLVLAGSNRLAFDALVTVARGAALQLAADNRVGTLTLQGRLEGTGAGTGRLTATEVRLDGGSTAAELGNGTLRSSGNSTLGERSAAGVLAVDSGTLTITRAQALTAAPVATVAAGATLALASDQTLGSLAGAGSVALATHTLTTGSAGASRFGGAINGSGALVKTGASEFTLTGNNGHTGSTTVQAGTLTVGDGATSGSLASSALVVDGTLKVARSDNVTLAQPISGSGVLEQSGSGRLTLAGSNKTYSGATVVSSGELATANAEALPDGSAVQVAANARLTLSGAETVRSIRAAGSTTLGGNVTASEDLLFTGPLLAAEGADGRAALRLSARRIEALHAGNRLGVISLAASQRIDLSAGSDGAATPTLRDLTLADLSVGNGGRIEAGTLTLTGTQALTAGTLELLAGTPLQGVAAAADAVPKWDNKVVIGLATTPAAAAVHQTGGSLTVAPGAQLQVQATQGGSVLLLRDDNQFVGGLQVLSGAAFGTPWAPNSQSTTLPNKPTQNMAVQSLVQVNAGTLNVGGRGIEADVVALKATTLATPLALAAPPAPNAPSTAPTIVARLPFDNTVGTAQSLPALTLWLNDAAFAIINPFGANNGGELRIDVGSRAFGPGRSLAVDAGYINVLPRGRGTGSTAVLLAGPQVNANGYRFFFDGAGVQGEIPVFYNGVLPVTPQVENSISATVSVSEGARRERFEEAVRTENVAIRLRAGVIAEVGPGRPATRGTGGAEPPKNCSPEAGSLRCAAAAP